MDDALVEVTQVDRDNAGKLFGKTDWSYQQFVTGKHDRKDKVQAFARARLAGVKEGLEMAAKECLKVSGMIGAATGSSIDSALCQAAASIRSLGPRP